MPKIAMPSSAMVLAPWTEALQAAADNQFMAFEVILVEPSANLDRIHPDEIEQAKAIAQANAIEICVHAPFFEINIAGFCREIRKTSVAYVNKAADFCAALGGKVLVVHAGNYIYNYPPGSTPENTPLMQQQWDYNIESLKAINAHANSRGVVVCLENIGYGSIDQTYEDLLEMRRAVGDSLKITFDVGHARLYSRMEVEKGFEILGEHIRHIHFTDNNGERDDHLPIGDGNFDYSSIMKHIRAFPHIVTLEVLDIGYAPDAIVRSRDYFQTL